MNLPATAIEFLDVFNGCFNQQRWGSQPLPSIHCYCFAKAAETDAGRLKFMLRSAVGSLDGCMLQQQFFFHGRVFCIGPVMLVERLLIMTFGHVADIKTRAEAALGGALSEDCWIHLVRDVAPNKRMFCLSFQLPEDIAFGKSGGVVLNGDSYLAAPAAEGAENGAEGHTSKKQRKDGECCM